MSRLYVETPHDKVMARMKQRWTYRGRKPSKIRYDGSPKGGWLLMRFPDRPRVIIEYALPILADPSTIKALFPGKMHHPYCQWGDFGNYHITEDGEFDAAICLIERAEFHLKKINENPFRAYEYLKGVV